MGRRATFDEPTVMVGCRMPVRVRDALLSSGAPSLAAAIVAACEAAVGVQGVRSGGGIPPAPFTGDRPHPDSLPVLSRTRARQGGVRDVTIEMSTPPLRRKDRPQLPPQPGDNPSGKRSYAPNPKGGKG